MFLYNNPHIKGFNPSYEHGGEHWINILGQQVDPSTISKDGVYFKIDANGVHTKHIYQGGAWQSNTGPDTDGTGPGPANTEVDNNNNNTTTNNSTTSSTTSNNVVNISKKNTETNDGVYADHDDAYDYKIIDGVWYTRKKGSTGEWISLAENKEATDKLNAAYPEAITSDNTTKDDDKDDDSEIDNANKEVEEGTNAVYYDEEFRSPEEANLLSGVGDTGLFDLIKAIDTTAKSFKKENYYDPGSKWDYMKAGFTNTTDEDLYFDPEQFFKTPHKSGKFLKDKEQMEEKYYQNYLDERHRRNPEKYSKVKDFDIDLFRETGHLDYRKGLFNRKHEGFEGDILENKYREQGATHIGWTVDDEGNYSSAFDYLTQNPDDPTKYNQQDFETGFSGIPFDPNNPDNYNYSQEYLNSPKHAANSGVPYNLNPNIISNVGPDGTYSKPVTGVSQNIEDLENPENAMTREAMLARGMSPEEIDDILGPGNDERYGGSIPKAQFGLGNYVNSRDGRSNLEQSLKLAGTVGLGSMLTRGLNTGITNRKNYRNAYEDYIDQRGTDWYDKMCTTGNCPSWEEQRLQLLDGHSEPNFAWFRGTDDNLFGKDIVMNKNNVLQKGDLADAYWQNVKQGVKDGLYTGAINYGLNFLGDRTRIGRNVKNWWEDKNLPTLNIGYLSRKQGGELPKAQTGYQIPTTGVDDGYEPFGGYGSEEKTYTVRVRQYPYGYEGGSDRWDGVGGMPPGHIEAFVLDQENLPNNWNKKEDGKFVHKGYVNRWVEADQEYNPLTDYTDGDYERGVREVDLELTLDQLNHFMKTAQTFKPGTNQRLGTTFDFMGKEYDIGWPSRTLPVSVDPRTDPAEYDFYDSNCADGVCKALDIDDDMNDGQFNVLNMTDPTLLMDYLLTQDDIPRIKQTGERRSIQNVLDGEGNFKEMENLYKNVLPVLSAGDNSWLGLSMKDVIEKGLEIHSSMKPFRVLQAQNIEMTKNLISDGIDKTVETFSDVNDYLYDNVTVPVSDAIEDTNDYLYENVTKPVSETLDDFEWQNPFKKKTWSNIANYWGFDKGGELPKFQFAGSPFGIDNYNTGYNPHTNQIDPFNINTDLYSTPISMDMFDNQTTPQEKTEPFFNSSDRMFAYNQSVNRSMDEWNAFTADMNDKIQNPSLIETQTSPFDVPEINIDPNLQRDFDLRSDMMDHRLMRTDPDKYMRNKMADIRKSSRETKSEISDYMDNIPKYQGKRKHVKELEKSQELGFDDRNEYLDWQEEQDQEEMRRKLRERQLNKDNKDSSMSFGDKLWNLKNRALDSKVGQTYSKIGQGIVRIGKPLNRILEAREEAERKETMMQNAYLSDNMFAARDADITGMKGDYDVNTGIFRPDDKVVDGTTMTKYGGSFFNDGGEMEIDMNTYKQLIAAGAQIEIL
tara:strand:- start:813 stop:5033 length:4221 start_codon:yes stop_codon:yes gene_type:complete